MLEITLSNIFVERVPEVPVPEPHPLAEEDYRFDRWPADAAAGTAPPSIRFVFMDEEDPGLDASVLGFTSGAFNHQSRTRINGLGNRGSSFINTANRTGNPGYPARRRARALLALNTAARGAASVESRG